MSDLLRVTAEALDDEVLMRTGRSVGLLASEQVARAVLAAVLPAVAEHLRSMDDLASRRVVMDDGYGSLVMRTNADAAARAADAVLDLLPEDGAS